MKNIIFIPFILSLLILWPVCPGDSDEVKIYYERAPWFVDHDMAQTVDMLIERAEEDMQKKNISEREYQVISLKNFEEPVIRTGIIDDDYDNHDYFCAILLKHRDKIDTLCFTNNISVYHYNKVRIPDSDYVHRLIDNIGKRDKEFYNNTKQAKEIRGKRMPVWNW